MPAHYDVILYAATGFTGQQTARYFEQHAPDGLRWAIAGRNIDKLTALGRTLTRASGQVVADSSAPASVAAMVGQAKVILTTAGPCGRYGEPVLALRAQQGIMLQL